ncbi:MAG: alpha/beta hydrolase [Spirochaetales bacterium]|nr:alpha/beta hydrolase [Spirochaetales bacterium]MCP5485113.1 alpha/beta hydrolase [Spirochaetales bacterium]
MKSAKKKAILWLGLGLPSVAAIALAVIYFAFPMVALQGLYGLYLSRADLTEASADIDGYTVPYYTGGNGPAVLLIHGFGDSKISFVQAATGLADRYRLVLPDVPGFGETAQLPERSYGIADQSRVMKLLLDQLGVERAYIVGNSMGGHIAASFALRYPERVIALVLLDPAGLLVDDPIPYKPAEHPLRDEADFDAYLEKAFVERPWVPAPFRARFIAKSQENFEWLNRIRADIRNGDDYILNQRIGRISAPTLIIWGDGDGIINAVHAPVWQAGIPGAELLILEDCGHAPHYERPEQIRTILTDFFDAHPDAPRT